MNLEQCPVCGISFVGLEIPEGLLAGNPDYYEDMSREELEKSASYYGWTQENKRYFTINCVYVKDMYNWRNNHHECTNCDAKFAWEGEYKRGDRN